MKQQFVARLAPIGHTDSPDHEWAYTLETLQQYSEDDKADEEVLVGVVQVLAALAARSCEPDAYAASPFPQDYLQQYPINLQSFSDLAGSEWEQLSIAELLGWLARSWGIETHLSIALRKLRFGQSTFRVRPTDSGLEVQEGIPRPTPTNPRMGQGLRILRDLGAIEDVDGVSRLTSFGHQLLSEIVHES